MSVEEEATGVKNAHAYNDYARSLGYKYVEVLDWTSSAGDWTFLISKDGEEWEILNQINNWPASNGFSYEIGVLKLYGTFEEVYKLIEEY